MSGGGSHRVVVFIDESNVYKDARRTFFNAEGPGYNGRIKPMRYAMLLADQEVFGCDGKRDPKEVRVYGGIPNRHLDLETYKFHRKQVAEWERTGCKPVLRPLRYPEDWPDSPAEQKGVDVQLALDVVVMGLQEEYDVAIIASTDTDLRPAIEGCHALGVTKTCEIEVAAWRGDSERFPKRIADSGLHIWCHYLNREDYDACHDGKNYVGDPEK